MRKPGAFARFHYRQEFLPADRIALPMSGGRSKINWAHRSNPIALYFKLAGFEDNLDVRRLKELTKKGAGDSTVPSSPKAASIQ